MNKAIFVLPDGEKITVPLVGKLELHEDKPKPKIGGQRTDDTKLR